MQITLWGAAGEVTGSAYQVQTDQARVLVDFGMFQGSRMAESRNRVPQRLSPRRLQAVLITHAHLDHTGRLPLLVKRGFQGPIYGTEATLEVTDLILRDAAKIQLHDHERLNRKRARAGLPPVAPLFTAEDVETTVSLFRPAPYERAVPVAPGLEARFVEAGHLLGSSSIKLQARENGRVKSVVFSGDLGPKGAPILKDAVPFQQADLVFLESTYGDRDHRPIADTIAEFETIVTRVVEAGGKMLVPTFAVGRAQLILYLLAVMFHEGKVPKFPVYIDSPMAIEATRIYRRHPELYDEELRAVGWTRPFRDDLDTLRESVTADDSRALNEVRGPCLIMAGAGMCNAGRILHHLKHNLWQPHTAVLIVGYQAQGSLGRLLVEGRKQVKIFGEKIAVRASVHTLGGFSAHAGQSDLLEWFGAIAPSRPRVVLSHGEPRGREPLARLIRERYGLEPDLPALGQSYEV